jgi:ABC-type branched-subunit amino acid transport system ATPase component
VLHGVNFTVNRGEVVTLLGRNGAGRTSTLKSILGLTGRRTGSIVVDGVETVTWPTYRIAHSGHRLLPRGARDLLEPVGRGEPHAAAVGRQLAA